jgi:hypothetical protein
VDPVVFESTGHTASVLLVRAADAVPLSGAMCGAAAQ